MVMCQRSSRSTKITLLVLASVGLVLAVLSSYFSQLIVKLGREIGIFPNGTSSDIPWSQRSAFNRTSITPAGWAFSIWGVIYFYQIALLVYCWTLVFRRAHEDGPYLCDVPDLLPSCFLIWNLCSSLCNIGWILVAEQVDSNMHLLVLLTVLLFGITICLYLALLSSYLALYREKDKILSSGKRSDYWLVVGLVQNGTSTYAAWVTVASFINVLLVLENLVGADPTASSIGCFAATMAIVIAYAVADLTVLDMATRFVFSPHLVVIWACAGSLAQNFVAWTATSVMTIVLLCLVCAALAVKLGLIVLRSRTKPILREGGYQLEE